jgi:hypothetical protein
MKKQKFFEEDWDYAVILDSARFDVFKEVYSDYFEGELEKRDSEASATPEWVHTHFSGRHNITWYSTNPFINGLGIKLNSFEYNPERYDTNPSRHITEVVELWKTDWDSEVGTVMPEKLREKHEERKDLEGNGRTVFHYVQPHQPFIGKGSSRMENMKVSSFEDLNSGGKRSLLPDFISENLPDMWSRVEESETAMKIGLMGHLNLRELLNVVLNDTEEELKNYHEENMRLALDEARKLVEDLDGKVIVTSDHGEAFGEEGVWGHHIETHIDPLVHVPWLKVEEVKSNP